ncbi:MAG TPA: PLP-dependent aspartate aminotransferase family protein [Chitinophagaceae bacterium]|nr:PLP-dependent aspartate aminotransferase family protein [Chitinophagaceae bacterium]
MTSEEISYIINELGEDRENYFNAIAPPIVQTSNFAFNSVNELRLALGDEMGGYLYSRGLNPTVEILRKKLAALDGAEDCLVFNSGAAAIFASVLSQTGSGRHIVSVRAPYTWAQRVFDVLLPRFGVATTYVDGSDITNWDAATINSTAVYYLESPNSWDYALQDLRAVAELARSRGIVTIVDNSYCTPLYQRPLELGIDLSLQTATKYIGGHSDVLGGVLCGKHEIIRKIFDSEYLSIGSGIQPFNAWLLLRGLRTLPSRLERISNSTRLVLEFLRGHQAIESVLFPLHPDFPQYELARKQMNGACGLLTIILRRKTAAQIERFCESLRHIRMAVSWGGHESLVIPKLAGIGAADFDPANREHLYIRLYVGLEEPEYLIADLRQALEKIE